MTDRQRFHFIVILVLLIMVPTKSFGTLHQPKQPPLGVKLSPAEFAQVEQQYGITSGQQPSLGGRDDSAAMKIYTLEELNQMYAPRSMYSWMNLIIALIALVCIICILWLIIEKHTAIAVALFTTAILLVMGMLITVSQWRSTLAIYNLTGSEIDSISIVNASYITSSHSLRGANLLPVPLKHHDILFIKGIKEGTYQVQAGLRSNLITLPGGKVTYWYIR